MKSKLKQKKKNESKSGYKHFRQSSKCQNLRSQGAGAKIEATEMWNHKNKTNEMEKKVRDKVDDETKTVTETKWHDHTHAHSHIREPEPVTETTALGNFLCSRNTQSQSSRLIREWGWRNLNHLRSSDLKRNTHTQTYCCTERRRQISSRPPMGEKNGQGRDLLRGFWTNL